MPALKVNYRMKGVAQEYLHDAFTNEYILDSDVLKKIGGNGSYKVADRDANSVSTIITSIQYPPDETVINDCTFLYIKNKQEKSGMKIGISFNNGATYPIELDSYMVFMAPLTDITVKLKSLQIGKDIDCEYIYLTS